MTHLQTASACRQLLFLSKLLKFALFTKLCLVAVPSSLHHTQSRVWALFESFLYVNITCFPCVNITCFHGSWWAELVLCACPLCWRATLTILLSILEINRQGEGSTGWGRHRGTSLCQEGANTLAKHWHDGQSSPWCSCRCASRAFSGSCMSIWHCIALLRGAANPLGSILGLRSCTTVRGGPASLGLFALQCGFFCPEGWN